MRNDLGKYIRKYCEDWWRNPVWRRNGGVKQNSNGLQIANYRNRK